MSKPSYPDDFLFDGLARHVLNLDVTFHWVSGSNQFWFRRQTRNGTDVVLVDARTGQQSVVPGFDRELPEEISSARVISPDGRQEVCRRENDLWLLCLASGEERRLTQNGQVNFAYGLEGCTIDLHKIERRRSNAAPPLHGILWSPDGQFLLALRQDLRRVPERLLVAEYASSEGIYVPVHKGRFSTAGESAVPDNYLVIIDMKTLVSRISPLGPQAFNDYALHYLLDGIVWWTGNMSRLFVITADRGGGRYALNSIELATGLTKEVISETARFNVRLNPFDYARPNVYVTSDGKEVIWYSERSGYGHLYLYDTESGEVRWPITEGEWVVFDLVRVVEEQRIVYFTAGATSDRGNPYYRYLYRVSFEGGTPQLLTPEIADHKFSNYFGMFRSFTTIERNQQPGLSISPDANYFIDNYSTTERPPQYVLRRTSGEFVAHVLSSDAEELYATGWRPPERVVVKAADGLTDLFGVITRPRDFDPDRQYPIIDSMYPGPQGSFAPRTFMDQLSGLAISHAQLIADAGFIVVSLDARGTAHRSRDFRDAFLGTEDIFGAIDHMVAIKQLAARRSYMDLMRVGVRGASFGGYGSLRAILLYPDFFKVAVAGTGPDGFFRFPSGISAERFFGVPAWSDEARAHYDLISNTRLVSRLKGSVLLIYGGIDENVPLTHAFTMINAFISADRDVDLLLMPESGHAAPREPYAVRRSIKYIVERLV